MTALYHFSEEAGIALFAPRAGSAGAPDEALVWAIDDWHAPLYYFPRDCPRACFWPGPDTTGADRRRWFGHVRARLVICVEAAWLARIRAATLYRYTMPAGPFRLRDATAGHWVAHEAVRPLAVAPVGDLLTALAGTGVELRITPTLIPLWEEVIRSTLAFSGTRLRNAQGYEALRLP